MVAVVPPHRDLDADAVLLARDVDRRLDQRRLRAVEVAHELAHAALVREHGLLDLGMPPVGQRDPHARVQERELAQAVLERLEAVVEVRERLGRGEEPHRRAALARRRPDPLERRHRVAALEAGEVLEALAPDPKLQPVPERVDHADADAVQPARHLVAVLVELAARVQLGHDDLGRAHPLALVDADRDAAAVVGDADRVVGVQRDLHLGRPAAERLVDAVVDDLVDHVVQARAVVGVADIHPRPLAHRFQALENLDGIGAVFLGDAGGFGHARGVLGDGGAVYPGALRLSRPECRARRRKPVALQGVN